MAFESVLSQIRFGDGLSPRFQGPQSVEDMLALLSGEDIGRLEAVGIAREREIETRFQFKALLKERRLQKGKPGYDAAQETYEAFRQKANRQRVKNIGMEILRRAQAPDGFRERLVGFWADHFTVRAKSQETRLIVAAYAQDAIRPHITGKFEDLLFAAVTDPAMLDYLDQDESYGPNSVASTKGKKPRGLNENLAREVMELHTLGVDGPYSQGDVRQLAELFTGLSINKEGRYAFNARMAEPGDETVLGTDYGPSKDDAAIRDVLTDLARHPATAAHIARKLAVHFVSDTVDAALVDHMTARYLATGGDLLAVYSAMLEHPSAWQPELANVKPPFDYLVSSLRALDVPLAQMSDLSVKQANSWFVRPLLRMGQEWERPNGPDGWSEADVDWITPQGLAERMEWAIRVPAEVRPDLPDPTAFALQTLDHYASPAVKFAASAAETQSEAIGLVLLSPAFQRR